MRTFADEAWDRTFLLTLFACSVEPLDNLKIQKIIFVSEDTARKEKLLAAHFPFYRNKLGPYSPMVANDVRKLEDCGFIDPETRQPTARGRYVLEYLEDAVRESDSARHSLEILNSTCKKYQDMKSFALKDIVYGMQVSVTGLKGEVMLVKDIPQRTTIIHPSLEGAGSSPALPEDIVDDLYVEFSLTAEDINPDSPANVKLARLALDAALTD